MHGSLLSTHPPATKTALRGFSAISSSEGTLTSKGPKRSSLLIRTVLPKPATTDRNQTKNKRCNHSDKNKTEPDSPKTQRAGLALAENHVNNMTKSRGRRVSSIEQKNVH
jgi:hypothetical protein